MPLHDIAAWRKEKAIALWQRSKLEMLLVFSVKAVWT